MKILCSILIALVALVTSTQTARAAAAKPAFPSWSQQINTTKRFTVLAAFGGAAVLDNETGLVWEQSPSTNTSSWIGAEARCIRLATGGRLGWRLPTVQELASLLSETQSTPALPLGHPFTNVQSSIYWSSTTIADGTGSGAWYVDFGSPGGVSGDTKTNPRFVWCVRGGQGVDLQ